MFFSSLKSLNIFKYFKKWLNLGKKSKFYGVLFCLIPVLLSGPMAVKTSNLEAIGEADQNTYKK